jgi:hypothetical protein
MRGRERDESVSDMVDLRAETSSLSDKTEFTETQGQSAPHHFPTRVLAWSWKLDDPESAD